MTQAFYNAISGINANQTQLVVVSDNIANMNTVGFKGSRVTFSDVYYNTLSAGSPPTKEMGGTNGKQIGSGVQVSSIDRDFTNGTVSSTGISTDCNIQGNGFFVVQSATGEPFYTRAGNFQVDSEGYLSLPNGYRLVGATNTFSTSGSKNLLQIPIMIDTETQANTKDLESKDIKDLNACSIAKGTFTITANIKDGAAVECTVDITATDNTLEKIVGKMETALADKGIDSSQVKIECGKTTGGKLVINVLKPTETGKVESLEFASSTSNFVATTELRRESLTSNTYSTKVLDYKQIINSPDSVEAAEKYSSLTITENGIVEISYSNGDKLSVYANDLGTNEFRYTTSDGIVIKGNNDVIVSSSVIPEANLQFQLVNFMNPNGLLGAGSNLFKQGPNSGAASYGTGNSNAFGSIKTGGLEASNVDLSTEFANMITAQRAVEANSRIFNTANQIMQTLVYLGNS